MNTNTTFSKSIDLAQALSSKIQPKISKPRRDIEVLPADLARAAASRVWSYLKLFKEIHEIAKK